MFTVYRATDKDTCPVPVQCVTKGYANRDLNGDTMFENTHFDSIDAAWQRVLSSAAAYVSLARNRVEDYEIRRLATDEYCRKAIMHMAKANDQYAEYMRQKEASEDSK